MDTGLKKDWSNDRGHLWRRKEDGDIDLFAHEYGYHNGPICENCGYCFCHHCDNGPTVDCSRPAIEGEFTETHKQLTCSAVSVD